MELICIKCPRGCNITVDGDKITGNLCPRGESYAKEEMVCPMRIVTALVKNNLGQIVPVKTSTEVPKSLIKNVLEEISHCKVGKTGIGDIVIENVCGTNANVVITGEPYISE